MENCDKTVERLEMVDVMEGNHTDVAEDFYCRVSQIDCLGQWQFVNHYLRIPNYRHGTVVSQIGHPVEPYSM